MGQAFRVLRVSFASRENLDREFRMNLANGGLFVPGRSELLYGEPVLVLVELPFCDATVELEGHVAQTIPVEFEENGALAGVALELTHSPEELRSRLERAVGGSLYDEYRDSQNQRVAPRSVAHVRARIDVPGVTRIEGETRNLSLAGVLVAITEEPPPIGQDVEVTIVHPTTAEERTLSGMVARHDLDDAGSVRGLGIQFTVAPDVQDDAIRYLNRVKASEHARRLGGITGSLETLGLPDLLTSFARCVPSGRFTLMRAGEVGTVHVADNCLVGAQVGAASGVKALVRMAEWQKGQFEFHAHAAPEDATVASPIPIEAALLEAARLVDESRAHRESGLSGQAGLRVEHRVVEGQGCDLDKTETQILDLAGTGVTVSRLLDLIQEPDGKIERAIVGLADRGILHIDER